jgi:hypothetical protein
VADATVPRPRSDDALPLRDTREVEQSLALWDRLPWLRIVLWTVLVASLAGFLALGTVRVGAGNWNGRRLRVSLIWDRFLEFLATQGFAGLAVAAVILAVSVALAGSAYLLWLAFGLRDAGASDSRDASAHS